MPTLPPRSRAGPALAATVLAAAVLTAAVLAVAAAADDDDLYATPPEKCAALRRYDERVNAMAWAQSAAGAAGLLACGAALLVVVGTRRDRGLAGRMLAGVLCSNAIFAVSDVVPANAVRTAGPLCGFNLVAPRLTDDAAACLPGAVMFLGVYASACYELLMVLVSIAVLETGRADPLHRGVEAAGHLGCVLAGVVAGAAYYGRCAALQAEMAALVAAHGDRSPAAWNSTTAAARYDRLGEAYDGLPGVLWGVALAPVGLALAGWGRQQWLAARYLRELAAADAATRALNAGDLGLDRGVDTRARLREGLREAVAEVVAPLQPYVVVIFAFAIPQLVGVTAACQAQTRRAFVAAAADPGGPLPCEHVVAVPLAFRALALVAVFFWEPTARVALWHFRALLGKAWGRVTRSCGGGYGREVQFPDAEVSDAATGADCGEARGGRRAESYRRADADVQLAGPNAMKMLAELDDAQATREAAAADGADPSASLIPYAAFVDG